METINSRKKVSFIFHLAFNVGSGIRDEIIVGSGSGLKKSSDPDP
jgi:hypothetical protein